MSRIRALIRSFRFAFAGVAYGLRSEKNLQIHAVATLGAVGMGLVLGISRPEWCAIVLAIGLVWSAELLNTGIERLGDAISREPNELIRRAKDAAAGAVLAAATAAGVVGLIVFLPKVWE